MSDPVAAAAEGPQTSPVRSLVDRIRVRNASEPFLQRPVPRWRGDVIVRYGRASGKAIDANAQGAPNHDLLADACLEIFLIDVDDAGKLTAARHADGLPAPVRFDRRLAELFQLGGDTPGQICAALYGDDAAITADARRLMAWQTGALLDDATPDEIDDLAGEADAAT